MSGDRPAAPKPAHLGPAYGAQFEDRSIAEAYHTRPPYPAAMFDLLAGLLPAAAPRLLDLGCGTGEITLHMRGRVAEIDAIDPSAAMLAVARGRPGNDDPRIRWVRSTAAEALLRPPYGLVVASESFHWMDWTRVPARLAAALHPDGWLVLTGGRAFVDAPWQTDLRRLLARYSTNRAFRPYDLVDELTRRGLFAEAGRRTVPGEAFEQSVDDYVESVHTRNGFSRMRMAPADADAFDHALRALVLAHHPDGVVRGSTPATVVWGRPGPASSDFKG